MISILCYNNVAAKKGDNVSSYTVNIINDEKVLISSVNIEADNVLSEVWACIRIVDSSIKNRDTRVYISYEGNGLYYSDYFRYYKLFKTDVKKGVIERRTNRILKRINKAIRTESLTAN